MTIDAEALYVGEVVDWMVILRGGHNLFKAI